MIVPKVGTRKTKLAISDIKFDPEYYARFDPSQKLISDYEENAEQILESDQLIQVSKDNLLIDGYHRLKALERVYGADKEIPVKVHETDNTDYIMLQSYAANTRHGLRNKRDENKRNVRRLYARGFNLEQIQEHLGLSKALVYEATTEDRKKEKEERNEKIIDLYLKAENTQETIADILGVPRQTVTDIIKSAENSTSGNFGKDFKPLLYNIWNTPKQDNDRKHFGAFPVVFMENLLYYHTDPLDIVYDPFGGGGTTVDVCRKMFRRYYVSDRKVIPGRENDIREHDIKDGLPKDLKKPDFVFLDPPYWKQGENQYSDSPNDLGNMSLDDFNDSMARLLSELESKKVKRISAVIQPTQYKNDWRWTDHIFDFDKLLKNYTIEMRYILPYSTEQYNAQMVDKAKESRNALCLNRDLVVWRLK